MKQGKLNKFWLQYIIFSISYLGLYFSGYIFGIIQKLIPPSIGFKISFFLVFFIYLPLVPWDPRVSDFEDTIWGGWGLLVGFVEYSILFIIVSFVISKIFRIKMKLLFILLISIILGMVINHTILGFLSVSIAL